MNKLKFVLCLFLGHSWAYGFRTFRGKYGRSCTRCGYRQERHEQRNGTSQIKYTYKKAGHVPE